MGGPNRRPFQRDSFQRDQGPYQRDSFQRGGRDGRDDGPFQHNQPFQHGQGSHGSHGRDSRDGGKEERDRERERREPPSRTLFIRNVPFTVLADDVERLFEPFGHVKLVFDLISKRGISFVTFFDLRDAIKAKLAMTGNQIHGRTIDIHFSLPRESDLKGICDEQKNQGSLHIQVMSNHEVARLSEIHDIFSRLGDLREVRPLMDPNHFIAEYWDARDCIRAYNSIVADDHFKDTYLKVRYVWDDRRNEERDQELVMASTGPTGQYSPFPSHQYPPVQSHSHPQYQGQGGQGEYQPYQDMSMRGPDMRGPDMRGPDMRGSSQGLGMSYGNGHAPLPLPMGQPLGGQPMAMGGYPAQGMPNQLGQGYGMQPNVQPNVQIQPNVQQNLGALLGMFQQQQSGSPSGPSSANPAQTAQLTQLLTLLQQTQAQGSPPLSQSQTQPQPQSSSTVNPLQLQTLSSLLGKK